MITPKNIIKPTTPYDAAKQIVEAIGVPEIFNVPDTHRAIHVVIENECPLTARGLVLDYQDGVLFATYGAGIQRLEIPICQEIAAIPFNPCINDAIVSVHDDLNALFKPESSFDDFYSFKYFITSLAFNHQLSLLTGQNYRFVLLDYFAIVQENKTLSITDKVFYLTRREAIEIIDTAITIPYKNF